MARGEFGFTEGFADHYCVRLTASGPLPESPLMKHAPGSRPEYSSTAETAASPAQARIDDHQVGPVAGRGNHRLGSVVAAFEQVSPAAWRSGPSSSMTSTRSVFINS